MGKQGNEIVSLEEVKEQVNNWESLLDERVLEIVFDTMFDDDNEVETYQGGVGIVYTDTARIDIKLDKVAGYRDEIQSIIDQIGTRPDLSQAPAGHGWNNENTPINRDEWAFYRTTLDVHKGEHEQQPKTHWTKRRKLLTLFLEIAVQAGVLKYTVFKDKYSEMMAKLMFGNEPCYSLPNPEAE